MNRRSPWLIAAIVAAGLAFGFAGYWFTGGGAEGFRQASALSRVDESIAQYEDTRRNGNQAQICVRAMDVGAAHLSAGDLDAYKHWEATMNSDCAKVPGFRPADAPPSNAKAPSP